MISLNVSQHSTKLLDAVSLGGSTAASSPFVVICEQTGVKVLPSVINAVVNLTMVFHHTFPASDSSPRS